ncbi:MAG: hypothetical protein HQ519_00185 [Planctomycetes bacterium]|nr:hypothetical protein [Planctomycetota bacterium]
MKLRTFSLLLLSLTVALPACGGKTITKKAKTEVIQGVGAETTPVAARIFADPGPTETLYLAHLRDSQDRPISGALVAVLVQRPEGMEMRQPRRKTVASENISGRDGIAYFLVESDGKEKYFWVGGDGVAPTVFKTSAAIPGKRVNTKCVVEVVPIAHLIISDNEGMRVNDAIVTFKPIGASAASDDAQKGNRPSQSDNYGNTRRSDGLGEVKYTVKPGKYGLIATKDNGTCRLYKVVNWDGDMSKPLEFKLPAASMTEQPW